MLNGKELEFKSCAAMVGSVADAIRSWLARMRLLITSSPYRRVGLGFQHLTCVLFADLAIHPRRIADRYIKINDAKSFSVFPSG
jgi:hypothetical protein